MQCATVRSCPAKVSVEGFSHRVTTSATVLLLIRRGRFRINSHHRFSKRPGNSTIPPLISQDVFIIDQNVWHSYGSWWKKSSAETKVAPSHADFSVTQNGSDSSAASEFPELLLIQMGQFGTIQSDSWRLRCLSLELLSGSDVV